MIGCDSKILKNISYQKYLVSRQTDSLTQIGLASWIREGGFERHLRKMRRIYERRYFFMQEELKQIKEATDIDWHSPNGGMSIWVNFFKDSKKIADAAKKKGIFFQHESAMDYSKSSGTHLRIGFAGVNEIEIKNGFEILKNLLVVK